MLTEPSAGDPIPQKCRLIEVRVSELRQIFNAIDPSPFRERDLDPRAEEFIVGWAKDLPSNEPWALVVHVERAAGRPDEATDAWRSDWPAVAVGERARPRGPMRSTVPESG